MTARCCLVTFLAFFAGACVSVQIIPSTFTQPKLGMIYEQKFQVLNANTSIGGIRIIDGAVV